MVMNSMVAFLSLQIKSLDCEVPCWGWQTWGLGQ